VTFNPVNHKTIHNSCECERATAFVSGLLQQAAETNMKELLSLRIQGDDSTFLCILSPALSYSVPVQLDSHSHAPTAVDGLMLNVLCFPLIGLDK
jgi:hypothetical protein